MKDKCKNIASLRRYWPGQAPDLVCVEHAEQSMKVSQVMGFYLHMEPFGISAGGPIHEPWPTCDCAALERRAREEASHD